LRARCRAAIIETVSGDEAELPISPAELAGTMFNIADLAVDVHAIRLLLEDEKRSRKEIVERARREAENRPNVIRLRRLAERKWAEAVARGEVEGLPPGPGEAAERLREILERNETRRQSA